MEEKISKTIKEAKKKLAENGTKATHLILDNRSATTIKDNIKKAIKMINIDLEDKNRKFLGTLWGLDVYSDTTIKQSTAYLMDFHDIDNQQRSFVKKYEAIIIKNPSIVTIGGLA